MEVVRNTVGRPGLRAGPFLVPLSCSRGSALELCFGGREPSSIRDSGTQLQRVRVSLWGSSATFQLGAQRRGGGTSGFERVEVRAAGGRTGSPRPGLSCARARCRPRARRRMRPREARTWLEEHRCRWRFFMRPGRILCPGSVVAMSEALRSARALVAVCTTEQTRRLPISAQFRAL